MLNDIKDESEKVRRSNARLVVFRGETYSLSELAKIYKVPYNILWSRIVEREWSIEESLFTPIGAR